MAEGPGPVGLDKEVNLMMEDDFYVATRDEVVSVSMEV